MADCILETRDLHKEFMGFVAVCGVSLKVERGTVHALIGPNGAGKTTLFNLLTKFLPASSGKIFFEGADITREHAAQTARRGLVRSFQISAVFPQMSVLENVRVALQRGAGLYSQFWKPVSVLACLERKALDILAEVELTSASGTVAGELPYGQKRALEVATTLALDPKLILLDEPTQGMGRTDGRRVAELIQRLAKGRTVLMVEHNMDVVARIADNITVLQRGAILAEGSYDAIAENPDVISAYLGDGVGHKGAAQ